MKTVKTMENGWKPMEAIENSWKRLNTVEHGQTGWKRLKTVENCFKKIENHSQRDCPTEETFGRKKMCPMARHTTKDGHLVWESESAKWVDSVKRAFYNCDEIIVCPFQLLLRKRNLPMLSFNILLYPTWGLHFGCHSGMCTCRENIFPL